MKKSDTNNPRTGGKKDTANEVEGHFSTRTGRWVLFATVLASSMAFINQSTLNVALPALQSALGASGSELLWIINGYNLMIASFLLVGGTLGDRFGRKKILCAGIVVFTAASLACGLSFTTAFLIGARVVQGIGGALMVPGSLAIITATFPPDRRGRAIGTWSAATTITTVAGPLIGGVLAEKGLWRFVFFINVPIAIAALAALILHVPESIGEGASQKIDFTGAGLATLSLVGIAFGFTSAPEYGFSDPRVLFSLIAGGVLLAAFVFVEKKSSHPMLSLAIFRSRSFSGANLLTFFLYGALAAYSLFLSLNIIQIQGYRETLAGAVFIPFVLLLAGMSRWSGKLVDKRGPRIPLVAGPSIVGAGFLITGFAGLTGGPADYWTTFLPGIVVFGVGMGLTVAPLTTTVMSSVTEKLAGTASGINNAASRVAGVLAIAIMGSIALISFNNSALDRISDMELPSGVRYELEKEVSKFGDAGVPESVPAEFFPEIDRSLKYAFVDTFRLLMYICAAMAWISAGLAALLVKPRPRPG